MNQHSEKILSFFSRLRFGGVVLLITLVFILTISFVSPAGDVEDVSQEGKVVKSQCALVQTMRFTRCMHQVTRRITVPNACVGLDINGMQDMYDQWQMETFSDREIKMSKDVDLFCPMHYVLMCNESGGLSVYQNHFGDAMAWLYDVQGKMSDYDPLMQEKLINGIGFDDKEGVSEALENRFIDK